MSFAETPTRFRRYFGVPPSRGGLSSTQSIYMDRTPGADPVAATALPIAENRIRPHACEPGSPHVIAGKRLEHLMKAGPDEELEVLGIDSEDRLLTIVARIMPEKVVAMRTNWVRSA
jgi:hypothetical protein